MKVTLLNREKIFSVQMAEDIALHFTGANGSEEIIT